MSICLAPSTDIIEGSVHRVVVPSTGPLAVLRVEGRVYALGDFCPHARAWMSEGFIEGRWLVCPTHFAEFDVATGQVRNAPLGCRSLPVFAVTERDGVIYLDAP